MPSKRNRLDILLDEFGGLQREVGDIRLRMFDADTSAHLNYFKGKLAKVNKKLKASRAAIHIYVKGPLSSGRFFGTISSVAHKGHALECVIKVDAEHLLRKAREAKRA